MKLLLLIPLLAFVVLSYSQPNGSEILVQEYPASGKKLDYSKLVDVDLIIPLENTEKSVLGELSKVQLAEERVFIKTSGGPACIFIFGLDGTFIQTIGKYGRGPGELLNISDFDVYKDELFILDLWQRKIVTYDFEGTVKHELKLLTDYQILRFIKLDGDGFLVQLNPAKGKSEYALARLSGQGEIVRKFLPGVSVGFQFNIAMSNVFTRNGDSSIRFVPIYGNTIYTYQNDEVLPYIKVNSNSPTTERVDFERIDLLASIPQLPNGMWGISFYSENKSFISFSYHISEDFRNVFLRKSGNQVKQENLYLHDDYFNIPDSRSLIIDPMPLYTNDSIALHYFRPGKKELIEDFKHSEYISKHLYSKGAQKRIEELNVGSNPVLVVYKVK